MLESNFNAVVSAEGADPPTILNIIVSSFDNPWSEE